MIEITLNKVTKNFGFGNILNEISFEIKKGEVVSLIGENGSGKSTILKLINGDESVTSGNISIRKNASIGYLKQIIDKIDNDIKVKDLLSESIKDIVEIENKLKEYENKMQSVRGKDLEKTIIKYTNLQEKFINIGGYEISEKVGKIINGFKINHLLELNYNTLSGGEKRIVSFACLMINNPDILLLDEPTNHLDIETLEWLENYLKKYKATILIVSHDRYFLDKISNKIILLEDGKIDMFYGNYNYFLEENEKKIMVEFKNYKDKQKQIKKMKESIKKLREFGNLAYPGGEPFFKRAKSIEKRLEKMEQLSKPKKEVVLPLEFTIKNRSGNDVLIVNDFNINFENKKILENANIKICFKEKVCLIGKNGSGKTTLIKEIIKGNNNIKLGSNVKIGYIPQEINFVINDTIYNVARKYFVGDESHLRSALFKFMFVGKNIFKKTSILSGGEKVRLKLFCLMQENVNFLILDEPTNHIDINTREILEETLNEYEGTVLFVSHDRYFINKVATKIVAIEDYKLKEYTGNYDDYKNFIDKNVFNCEKDYDNISI